MLLQYFIESKPSHNLVTALICLRFIQNWLVQCRCVLDISFVRSSRSKPPSCSIDGKEKDVS